MTEIEKIPVVQVAVPRPLMQAFTYEVPEEWITTLGPGHWVQVPFGRGHTHAFVLSSVEYCSIDSLPVTRAQLKKIQSVSDEGPILSEEILKLCQWVSKYYHSPLGNVLQVAVPAAAIKKLGKKSDKPPRKKKITDSKSSYPEKKQFVLNAEQETAVAHLIARLGQFHVSLLEGVTGSGKTEVYIGVAKQVLLQGKSVLFLVPEISLTPQLHARLEQGLGCAVGQWHSALAQGERVRVWEALRTGELRALIGARSGVFAPMKDLGLIVIDEEHDGSYKQEEQVRYHAKDVAQVRARNLGIPVILGSATPLLETLERVRQGKIEHELLTHRARAGGLPMIELIALNDVQPRDGIQAILADQTIDAIRETWAKGQKVLIYLNRRGFSAFLVCVTCGSVPSCRNCALSLTYHHRNRVLKCHVCAYEEPAPSICSHCQGNDLLPYGAGTESLETDLPKLFPEMRAVRLDRDQVTSATRLRSILDEFESDRCNTLIGTQMVVKGHDFSSLGLVVVMFADALFRWPDFRSSERAYQVLTQVSGRAGRGDQRGRVIIQTYDPEHPVLQVLMGHVSRDSFLAEEREIREALRYPPFSRMARVRIEGPTLSEVKKAALDVCGHIQNFISDGNLPIELLGPSEACVARVKGLYRWDFLLKGATVDALHRVIGRLPITQGYPSLTFDIDPVGMT